MNCFSSDNSYKIITPQKALQLLSDISCYTVLVDVRCSDEYAAGHIKGAVNIPLSRILCDCSRLFPDKNQELILYCHSGQRSKTACIQLANLGYSKVYDLGGIIDWPFGIVLK